MTTGQRIRLYLIGFLLGCVLVYFMLFRGKDRSYWLPENRVKSQLQEGKLSISPFARCRMECLRLSEEEVLEIMKTGSVNFSGSDPHAEPCPRYRLEGSSLSGKKQTLIFETCRTDTTYSTTLVSALLPEVEKDTCGCE